MMVMETITEQFNNREIAAAVWLTVFFIWALSYQPLRKTIPPLIKTAFNRTIIFTFMVVAVYISLIVYGLERIGIWDIDSHLKDTIIWSVTVGMAMVVNVNSARQNGFFRKAIKDAIKLTILLEFIIGFYPYSLPVELVLMPVLVLLGAMMGVASTKPEYLPAKKLLSWPIAILGALILWHSVSSLTADSGNFFSLTRLTEIMMPSILTLLFLPFIYLLALSITYELVFLRLEHRNKNPELTRFMKRKIFLRFGLNLGKLIRWSSKNPDLRVNSKDEAVELIGKMIKPTQTSLQGTGE